MAKNRKKVKRKKPENERYEIQVEDWEVEYHFELNKLPKDFVEGVFWENSKIILIGNIVSPILKNAHKARVEIVDNPKLDDNWAEIPTVKFAKAIGFMEIPRGDDTLILYCWIPSRSSNYIPLAVDSGKIKFVSIFGTNLKWRKGEIFGISLSANREEE